MIVRIIKSYHTNNKIGFINIQTLPKGSSISIARYLLFTERRNLGSLFESIIDISHCIMLLRAKIITCLSHETNHRNNIKKKARWNILLHHGVHKALLRSVNASLGWVLCIQTSPHCTNNRTEKNPVTASSKMDKEKQTYPQEKCFKMLIYRQNRELSLFIKVVPM